MLENFKEEYKKAVESVKKYRKDKGLPSRDSDIAAILGYKSRTHFANLMGSAGKVTADHIKDLKLHFPDVFENQTPKWGSRNYEAANHSETAILNLTESNRMLAEAQLKIADSNQQLTFMVKGAIEGSPQGNLVDQEARIERLASLIGLIGRGKRFASQAEALETINIVLSGEEPKAGRKDKKTAWSKSHN